MQRRSAEELWDQTPNLLGPDGKPYRKSIIASQDGRPDAAVINPDATRELERNEERTPAFAEHPCPPAAQMLWLLARRAGVGPPWRLRASSWVQARYSREVLARALWPHAIVLWDLPPTDPGLGLQFVVTDQLDPTKADLSRG